MIVDGEIDHAVGPERRATRDRPALHPRIGDEDLPHVRECCAFEAGARERERRHLVSAVFHVVEIDAAIGRELRMHDRGLERAGLDTRDRPAHKRLGQEHAAAHQTHAPRQLGDHDPAIWRKCDVARATQAVGDRHETHAKEVSRRALALWLAIRRARSRDPGVEHERDGGQRLRRRGSGGRIEYARRPARGGD